MSKLRCGCENHWAFGPLVFASCPIHGDPPAGARPVASGAEPPHDALRIAAEKIAKELDTMERFLPTVEDRITIDARFSQLTIGDLRALRAALRGSSSGAGE